MSRREEVEASKWSVDRGDLAIGRFRLQCTSPHDIAKWHNDKALALADEVDARDTIIDKLIAMLADEVLTVSDEERGIFISIKTPLLHARACEIAGRKS